MYLTLIPNLAQGVDLTVCFLVYILEDKKGQQNVSVALKLYQCVACKANFLSESDWAMHSNYNENHRVYNEYELEEFLTRFLPIMTQ